VARRDELELALEQHPSGAAVLRVIGEVDLATVSEMERALAASSSSSVLVVDLTECTFLDSSALHVLLSTAANAKEPNGFAIVAPEGGVRRVLDIAGARTSVSIHATVAEAVEQHAGSS
jgi:anti-anti-sigma factor